MSAGCALTPADRYSTKMASEGASGEQPPPVQTLATAVLGSVDTVRHAGWRKAPGHTGVFLPGWRWQREKCSAHLFRSGSWSNSGDQREPLDEVWRKTRVLLGSRRYTTRSRSERLQHRLISGLPFIPNTAATSFCSPLEHSSRSCCYSAPGRGRIAAYTGCGSCTFAVRGIIRRDFERAAAQSRLKIEAVARLVDGLLPAGRDSISF